MVAGVGFGNIENTITDKDGNVYHAHYTENPVGYLGIGFGADTSKGFQWGVDLGWLQTGGPQVFEGEAALNSTADRGAAVEDIKDSWMFGNALPNIQVSLGYGF